MTPIEALAELIPGQQWVCFNKKKCPFHPGNGKAAEADDPATWGRYDIAHKALLAKPGKYAGIGREFIKEQGITGIDLDHCLDENGELTSYAQEVVRLLNSYTEYSPSGQGLHIWAHGSIPDNIGPDPKGVSKIEMCDSKHYFTWTGKHLEGTPLSIEERQEQLTKLHRQTREIRAQGKERKAAPEKKKTAQAAGDTPYGLAALDKESQALGQAREGGRNHQLNTSAYSMGQLIGGNELSFTTVVDALSNAAARAGLDDSEIEKTLRSGLDAGMKEPRSAPKTSGRYQDHTPTSTSNYHKPTQDDTAFILDCLGKDEWGDSLLFAHLNRGKAVYDHTGGQWYVFDKHHWLLDEQGKVKHLVSGELASVYLQAGANLIRQTPINPDEDNEAKQESLKKTVKALEGRAFALRKVARNSNVLNFASSQEGLGITSSRWDTDHWLLPVLNGVVNLRTGQLRDGKPADYIRTFSPTNWEGLNTPAPRWEAALTEIFEDRPRGERDELINFLQRLFGYGITGHTYEHCFLVMYGEEGRNGKDTITTAIGNAIGPMGSAISNDTLLSNKHSQAGGAKPHLVDLQGKRIGWASEPPSGARFDVAQVKQLTGGGAISARQLYGREYQFIPTHLLLLLTNHKPHADATDRAFWERLRLVTLNMRFVDNPKASNERKKDTSLWKTLEREASGILAWLVRGCLTWQSQGLNAPATVLQATEEYRREEDNIALFLEECCIVKDGLKVLASRVYETYNAWCKAGSMFPLNSKNFGMLLSKQFRKARENTGMFYHGVGILADGTDNDPVGCVGSKNNPTRPIEPPVDCVQATYQANSGVGCVGTNGKAPSYSDEISENRKFSDLPYTPYTSKQALDGLEPLVEWSDTVVYGQNNPTLTLHADPRLAEVAQVLMQSPSLFWARHQNDIPVGTVTPGEYLRRLAICLDSGDDKQVRAATEDIARRCAIGKGRE